MYEVSFNEQEMKEYSRPHEALKYLTVAMREHIILANDNPLNYITQTMNEGKGLKITATFSEERKKCFEENPV